MAATWPAQLQQLLNENSFSFAYGNRVLTSQMGIGPEKMRLLYTKAINKFSCSINITTQQFIDYFDPFYQISLAAGTLSFNFVHPLKQTTKEFKIIGEPTITPIGGGNFTVTMTWEEQP